MWRICGELKPGGWHSLRHESHLKNSRKPSSVRVLGDRVYVNEDVKGQGDPHDEGRDKKHRFPWVLQIPIRDAELVSSTFLDAEIQRLMGILETCVMDTVSCKTKYIKKNLSLLLSYHLPRLSKSVKYQKLAGLPRVSWIEALAPMCGDLWASARDVPLWKSCDTSTGGHCQAESQGVVFGRRKLSNSQWVHVFARHTVVLCFKSWGDLGIISKGWLH